MHKIRTLDWPEWQPMQSDLPNSFRNNSYNPYEPGMADKWNNSVHKGKGIEVEPFVLPDSAIKRDDFVNQEKSSTISSTLLAEKET